MLDRILLAVHRALARLVMGRDADVCPYCGSPVLVIERDLIDADGVEHILVAERCQTCGELWGEGSDAWNWAHPPTDMRLATLENEGAAE